MAAPVPVRIIRASELVSADPTAGMDRELAFEQPGKLWSGRVTTAPGVISGWHHHDSNESALYVVAGVMRFEFDGYDGYLDAEAGDFVHVPAFTVHRESNPLEVPSVAVIARAGGGLPTVNVDGPRVAPPPELSTSPDRAGSRSGKHRRGRTSRWSGPPPPPDSAD